MEHSDTLDADLEHLREAMLLTTREVGTLASGIDGGLRRAISGLTAEGAKLSDALRGVARSMADTMLSIAMKPITQALAGAMAQGIGGLMPFAAGGAFSQGQVIPFAKGGVVSAPTTFGLRGATGLMGEAGPEAIMPLQRGPDGRLGVAASGGRPMSVTFHIQTPDVAGFQRSQSQIAAQMQRLLARGNRNL